MHRLLLLAVACLVACPSSDERSTVYGGGELTIGFTSTGGGPNGAASAPGLTQALLVHPDDFVCGSNPKAQLAVSDRGEAVESLSLDACIPDADIGSFLPCGVTAPLEIQLNVFLYDPELAGAEDLPLSDPERGSVDLTLVGISTSARVITPYNGAITLASPTNGDIAWSELSWGCDDGSTEPWDSDATAQWDFDGGVQRPIDPLAQAPN